MILENLSSGTAAFGCSQADQAGRQKPDCGRFRNDHRTACPLIDEAFTLSIAERLDMNPDSKIAISQRRQHRVEGLAGQQVHDHTQPFTWVDTVFGNRAVRVG